MVNKLKMKKTYVIAEIGINHMGSMDKAKKLIDAAVRSGVDAVKFQTYITEKRAPKGNTQVFDILKSNVKNQKTKFLVISFSSDWLYTTKENKDIVIALNASGADVSYSEIITDKGHDSFLLDVPDFLKTLKSFIDSMYEKFKNEKRI